MGTEVEVLAEAALEVRPYLAGNEPVGLAGGTGLVLAAQAGLAVPARTEVAIQHAITDLERLPGGIGAHALAELGHRAHMLVAGVERQRPAHLDRKSTRLNSSHVRISY